MNEPQAPNQQTVVVAQPAAPPRWIPYVMAATALFGTLGMVIAALLTFGAWRAQVDLSLGNLDRRLTSTEGDMKTVIPVVLGLSKDVTYLADRARREDDRRERQARATD